MKENLQTAIQQAIEEAPDRSFVESIEISFTIKDVERDANHDLQHSGNQRILQCNLGGLFLHRPLAHEAPAPAADDHNGQQPKVDGQQHKGRLELLSG